MRHQEKILRIILAVVLSATALALASAFTDTDTAWYQGLQKPELQPPPLVFGIVWTLLYAPFAASLAIVWNKKAPVKTLLLYLAIGILNALWTYVFFAQENATGAVFVLLIIILVTLCLFLSVYDISKTAAYLLIPYMVWITFALYLNYEIAFLN